METAHVTYMHHKLNLYTLLAHHYMTINTGKWEIRRQPPRYDPILGHWSDVWPFSGGCLPIRLQYHIFWDKKVIPMGWTFNCWARPPVCPVVACVYPTQSHSVLVYLALWPVAGPRRPRYRRWCCTRTPLRSRSARRSWRWPSPRSGTLWLCSRYLPPACPHCRSEYSRERTFQPEVEKKKSWALEMLNTQPYPPASTLMW